MEFSLLTSSRLLWSFFDFPEFAISSPLVKFIQNSTGLFRHYELDSEISCVPQKKPLCYMIMY
ncbi:MAG TPA: hypothetical protein PLE24_13800 [Chitinispirillaceae bacterium]|nr:hypothetical protein [Chitinispirillaceae bacterium]